ncbi:hypothetical protein QR665_04195 [Acinetobacter gerneri]|uniref:hypothetical protein n=1 Tax=Acinetobacter gerneri TaxID=202952 RepID=UPI002936B1F2|nr:hypothetical protein [Acinetobacter gerneri]MDV2438699.1 hypothetical protein [Acinetobacter gerneri]
MSGILSQDDRQTPRRDLGLICVAVAANAIVRAGYIAVANKTGFAVEGSKAKDITYLGIFDETIDNTGGADGDVTVMVRTHHAFLLDNDATDPVTQASIGKKCYISTAVSVSGTSATDTKSEAGIVLEINENGVWVA